MTELLADTHILWLHWFLWNAWKNLLQSEKLVNALLNLLFACKGRLEMWIKWIVNIRLVSVKVKDRFPEEEQQNVDYEIDCYDCNSTYMGKASRQLNVRLKKHKQCLKHVPKSLVDLKKLENRLAIAQKIDFWGTKILQYSFNTHKVRLTAEALCIWTNKKWKDSIQLANIR